MIKLTSGKRAIGVQRNLGDSANFVRSKGFTIFSDLNERGIEVAVSGIRETS
ncbi:hypothetical protein [Bacillus changyiensis]|uniref:hypothetical protein n=1 Tax=Bacillus changyiensis TaxID=3004103 RepID=UPI0022E674DA|nr:hypothetical protein [Bacillus changyiensis]MDA1476041.1 hypothetical protein [Bacillus changyiensis]